MSERTRTPGAQSRASSRKNADPGSAAALATAARAAGLTAAAVGVLVLVGWLLNVRPFMQVLSGEVAMVPNTAVAFILAGLSLWWRAGAVSRSRQLASQVAAAASGLLGFFALAEYASGLSFGIDELLFQDRAGLTGVFPGRMSVPAAIGFVAIGVSLLLSNTRRAGWVAEALALVPGLLGLASLADYSYGMHSIEWIGYYKGMAIHTAVAFLVLSLGVLLSRGDRGFSRLMVSDTAGGRVARRILPVALIVPLVLGWLCLAGQRAGLYGAEFGTALAAVSNAVVLVAIFWGIAAALMRTDEERRRAEEALEGSERRYRDLAAFAPVGIYRSTREGRFLSVNAALARLLGYDTIAEVLQLDIRRDIYFDNADRERLIAENERLGGTAAFEVRLKRKDGSPVWVRLDSRGVADESGRPTRFEGFVHDITERKRSEDALRKAEEQYRLLFQSSPIPMWVVDRETLRHLAVNDAAVAHYGYSREEFLAMDLGRIQPAEDPAALRRTVPEENAGIENKGIWRHLKKDGSAIQVEIETHTLEFGGRSAWLAAAHDITERLQAEESLRKLLHAVEHAENVIFMTDPDGRITYVNPAFEKTYGYSKAEALGKTPRILKSGQHDRTRYERFWQRLLAGESVREEFINRTRDGHDVTIEGFVSPVLDAEGRRIGFIAVQHDVSERKRAEQALRKSERRFSLAFHASPIPTIISEIETGRMLDVNDQFLRNFGYSREEVVGKTSLEVGIWADPGDRDRAEKRLREEAAIRDRLTRIRTRSGETRDVVGSAVPIDLGSIRSVLWTFLDVTERQKAEKEMRKSEERFRKLFDSNTIGIVIADLTGNTLEANEAYLAMLGYTREEFREGTIRWNEITPAEHLARDLEAVEELRRTGIASPWEKELLRRDGTRVPVLIGVAMLEATEGSCIAYIVDLTERRRMEEQFRQAQKMEAVGKLAGGVAHDFNNLLTVMLGYADLMAERFQPDSVDFEQLGEIIAAGQRAAGLTRQLLAFSRQQVLERRVLDVNELIRNVEKMLRRLIGEDVDLAAVLDPALSRVRADAGQLEQVIMNLAVNARDAMPRGGRLTIETANVDLDEAYARSHVTVRPGKYVMVAVSDTGSGMSAEVRSRVFEPFFTTKEQGKGTGLGLATVYGIVKQSGGYIWVYSEPEKGTTFKIYLPKAEEDVEAEAAPEAEPLSLHGSETVLLVEDEESVRSLSREILEARGYTVLEASGGAQALDIARDYPQPIHLVLTDIVMPEMGGTDLALRLEALRPGIRVLYMSGYTDDTVVRHGFLQEGRVFLQKPFAPESLARKVREVLRG
jgi:two-component system cell cycle sensor histidine kinase/response regulator CckA